MVWVLAGFMGCGKSSVGRLVARMAACPESLLPPESFTGSQKKCSPAKAPDGSVAFATGRNSDENLPAQAVSEATGRNSGDNLPAQLVFVDLDAEIEAREGRSIREIFAEGGEAAFRAVERETLGELLLEAGVPPEGRATRGTEAGGPSASADGGVSEANSLRGNNPLPKSKLLISLGGGTLTDPESRELVRKHCHCIYLRASLETLAANLRWEGEAASRPMLAGADPNAPADSPDSLEARISAMMDSRAPIYERAADVIIDIDGLSYEQAALQILNYLSTK